MFLNLVLFWITIIFIYIGYTYKSLILFVCTLLLDEVMRFTYKFLSAKCKFDEQLQTYSLKFFINNDEYKLVVDSSQIKKPKIIALNNNRKYTDEIIKIIGPNYNCFGMEITPRKLGLNSGHLSIWKDSNYFKFGLDDRIDLLTIQENKDSDEE